MSKINLHNLERLAEPLLLPLYFRAMENRRPDPLIRDPIAQTLLAQIDYDFSAFDSLAAGQAGALQRTRQFDICTQAFLQSHPAGVVVEIGCGLDPRWIDLLSDKIGRPFLFLAEGFLARLEEADARCFVAGLRARFPGAELVLDMVAPFAQERSGTLPSWQIARDCDLEAWAEGIRLLEEWSCDQAAPGLEQAGQVLRFRLGEPATDLPYAFLGTSEGEQEEIFP